MKCVCVDTRGYTRRIRIESKDETQVDALNNPVEQWETYFTCRAMGRPVRGREYFQGDQAQATVTHRYRVLWNRKTKQITPKMRIVDVSDKELTQTLNITRAVNVDSMNQEMEIDCVEVV